MAQKAKLMFWAAFIALLVGLIAPGQPTASAKPATQTSFTGVVEICTVNSSTLNVRSGPGTSFAVSAPALKMGQKVVLLAAQGTWGRHGNGGWSSIASQYMTCQKYARNQVTQVTLPSGYWLHATATAHNGGGRLPEYDPISTPMGESFQPWLPLETQRQGFDVSITQIAGTFTFHGVACFIELDKDKVGDSANREEAATHQNNGMFTLTSESWARIVCDQSDVAGYSIALGGSITHPNGTDSNSPYGPRSNFVPNNAAGQFLMEAYACGSDTRLPDYDAVKESNGDVWQPWLPNEEARSKVCFEVPLVALDTTRATPYYTFNGIRCQLWLDEKLEGVGDAGHLVAANGNGISFEVDLYMNEIADKGEAWGLARCAADPKNGFSLRWHEN
jgi:hypothetical protein